MRERVTAKASSTQGTTERESLKGDILRQPCRELWQFTTSVQPPCPP